MLDHAQRLDTARAAVDYITGQSPEDQRRPVPNCPGWTVYNAAVHIGRVSIAWQEMINATPDDPESRERGYAKSAEHPPGTPTAELAAWAHAAIDHLDTPDLDRPCYFSMTGGEGTVALWGRHAASELGVHRLDVESALGHDHAATPAQALDATTYTCHYFLPAMRRVTGIDPGPLSVRLVDDGYHVGTVAIPPLDATDADDVDAVSPSADDVDAGAVIEGPPVQVLLALWGREHHGVSLTEGDQAIWDGWRALPGQAFQFGTWD